MIHLQAMWPDESLAVLFVRLFLGVLFFFQGYDKVFKVKINGVVGIFEIPAGDHHVPRPLLTVAAVFTSFAELLGGALLILGLFKSIVLPVLGIDLLMVAVAFGVIRPMWDMQHVFPRFVMLAALMLFPPHWDFYSLDHFLGFI